MSDINAAPVKKRPTSITVLGVLGIVFSSLGLLGALGSCAYGSCVGSMWGAFAGLKNASPEASAVTAPMEEIFNGIFILMIASGAAQLVANSLGLTGSIGLIANKAWSKNICTAYAVVLIVLAAALILSVFLFIDPLIERLLSFQTTLPSDSGTEYDPERFSAMFGTMFPAMMKVVSLVSGILSCAWPVLLIIFLNTPKTKAHFEKLRAPAA